jgi:hypothetical protein
MICDDYREFIVHFDHPQRHILRDVLGEMTLYGPRHTLTDRETNVIDLLIAEPNPSSRGDRNKPCEAHVLDARRNRQGGLGHCQDSPSSVGSS